eukprot:NODE_293_length_10559_cov_1.046463.p7 type:complete len:168 gc:universal NODE_293_length_10559_cov_1.046463:8294-8797(+)
MVIDLNVVILLFANPAILSKTVENVCLVSTVKFMPPTYTEPIDLTIPSIDLYKLELETAVITANARNKENVKNNNICAVALYLSPELEKNAFRFLNIQQMAKQGAIKQNKHAEAIEITKKTPAFVYLDRILSTLTDPLSVISEYATGLLLRVEFKNLPPSASKPAGS